MKKTGHIIHIHTNREWGGGEYQVLNLVKGLVARGWPVKVFAHHRGELFKRLRAQRLPVAPLPRGGFLDRVTGRRAALRDRVAGLQAALVHVHDSPATSIGIDVGTQTDIPVVLSRRVASPLRRNVFSRRKYSARALAAVIAISETVKNVFARSGYPRDRIHVVPSGLDVAGLETVAPDPEFRRQFKAPFLAGGVGKLSHKKNWQLLVRVAAEVARRGGPEVAWCIAGDGPELDELRDLARRLGVGPRIHFLGFRKDATRVLKSLDVLFFPSLMEGASVTVREAMLLGVPVVAANAAGTVESLAGHGWVVNPHDVEGAARSVIEVLTDATRRNEVCRKARALAAERYSIDVTVEGTVRVYEKVLTEWARKLRDSRS